MTDQLDKRVQAFLDKSRDDWAHQNVPYVDGKTLYDIIVSHGYTRALEIGTSTGLSGIWIAWALSKTGGRLVTLEINKERQETAIRNFATAGVSDYIEPLLGDAHELIGQHAGPLDFVFSDADKDWYQHYFTMVLPILLPGGCIAVHNVLDKSDNPEVQKMIAFAKNCPDLESHIDNKSTSGMSLHFKKHM